MIQKHPIFPHRVRKVPKQFSWVDHRLVRDHWIDRLSHQAAALYLFLVTVADAQGLSYYSDSMLAKRLGMEEAALDQARNELIRPGLIAWKKPIYQVLPIEEHEVPPETERRPTGRPLSIGQILKQIAPVCVRSRTGREDAS